VPSAWSDSARDDEVGEVEGGRGEEGDETASAHVPVVEIELSIVQLSPEPRR